MGDDPIVLDGAREKFLSPCLGRDDRLDRDAFLTFRISVPCAPLPCRVAAHRAVCASRPAWGTDLLFSPHTTPSLRSSFKRSGAMSVTHSQLVEAAAKWLAKKCSVVVTEIATTGEEPDALGWHGSHSTLVECKATRADFLADRTKSFRRELEMGIGQARYFLTPLSLVSVEEVPPGWGLLEFDGEKVRQAQESGHFEPVNHRHEIRILLSTIRRIGRNAPQGMSIRFYTLETKCRATAGVILEDEA